MLNLCIPKCLLLINRDHNNEPTALELQGILLVKYPHSSFSFFVIPFVIIVKKFAPLIIPDCSFVQLPKLDGEGLKSVRGVYGVEHEELSRNQQPASPSCFTQHLLWSRPVDRSKEEAPEKTKGTNATKNQCQLGLAKKILRTSSLSLCVGVLFFR